MRPGKWKLTAALVVAIAQVGFLASMIYGRAAILRDGAEVMLKVEPVDPRDLLRGDYVRLGYAISNVPKALFEEPLPGDNTPAGEAVFVRLAKQEDGLWMPVAARFGERPRGASAEGQVDLAGKTAQFWQSNADSLRIDYGLERFYLPEGEGKEIERDMRQREFSMLVAVGEDGTGQIKAFFDGATQLYAEPLY